MTASRLPTGRIAAAPKSRRRPNLTVVGELPIPDDYDERYLVCRDLRHAWEELGWYRGSGGAIHRFLICSRCRTERHDDDYAVEMRRYYHYPEGYRIDGRIDQKLLRIALRDRAKIHRSADEIRAKTKRR